jgi:hypothetical protein
MVKTVGIERTVTKYQARVAVAGADYQKGVQSPKVSWSAASSAAKSSFQAGVTAGDIADRWDRGISEAGDGKWSSMSVTKGVPRFAPGVTAGLPYYRSGMGEVLGVIEGISWTKPGPAGSAGNYAIVQTIGDALHAMKVGRT